jgi:hypothetical protein
MQQIATTTGSEDSAQTAKDPVVEHKGWLTSWFFLFVIRRIHAA